MSTAIAAIDAWAQPANGRTRELLPEVARLFEKSGSGHLLDQRLTPEQTVAEMDKAGVDKLMRAALVIEREPPSSDVRNARPMMPSMSAPDRLPWCGITSGRSASATDVPDFLASTSNIDRSSCCSVG